ncbi:MAG: DUF2007 domain-containing protein [Planctomycetes bacterium]|nr:DUF2007 domain-containing protein [Planctomycetota bacterium]
MARRPEAMPYCPECLEEYRAGFTECADCKVPLVEALEAGSATVTYGELVKLVNVETPTQAELIRGLLEEGAVPAFLKHGEVYGALGVAGDPSILEGQDVLVPAEHLEQARAILAEADLPREAADEEVEAAVMERVAPLAGGRGDAGDLVQWLAGQTRALRSRVLGEVAALPDGGPALLARLLGAALDLEDPELVGEVGGLLASRDEVAAEEVLLGASVGGGPPPRRRNAASTLALLDSDRALERLIRLLEDPDTTVRDAALEGLYGLAGESFDFDPESAPDTVDNKIAVGRWLEWFRRRSRRLRRPLDPNARAPHDLPPEAG